MFLLLTYIKLIFLFLVVVFNLIFSFNTSVNQRICLFYTFFQLKNVSLPTKLNYTCVVNCVYT